MALLVKKASFQRPNDTNAYTIGDNITNSTSAGVALSFGLVGAHLYRAMIVKSGTSALAAAGLQLALFQSDPGAVNDNAAFVLTYANRVALLSLIVVPNAFGLLGAGSTLMESEYIPTAGLHPLGGQNTSMWGLLIANSAYAPTAQESFEVTLVTEA